jgi:glycosyltransferase involved in cell wall biosynthesis
MDYGVPVIATDTGGLGEQLEDGVTGLLTDASDSSQLARQMLRLKNDRELYQTICRNIEKKLPDMEWGGAAELVAKLAGVPAYLRNR